MDFMGVHDLSVFCAVNLESNSWNLHKYSKSIKNKNDITQVSSAIITLYAEHTVHHQSQNPHLTLSKTLSLYTSIIQFCEQNKFPLFLRDFCLQ